MSKKIVILAFVGLLLMVGTVAGTLFAAKHYLKPEATPAAAATAVPTAVPDPIYESIEPAFVVNVQDGPRYRFFQVQVDVMARDQTVITRFEKYQPRIKGELTMLFGGVNGEQLHDSQGREALRKDTLVAINRILTDESGRGGIEAVYFTKFVVQ